jgi:hypothetical protein
MNANMTSGHYIATIVARSSSMFNRLNNFGRNGEVGACRNAGSRSKKAPTGTVGHTSVRR